MEEQGDVRVGLDLARLAGPERAGEEQRVVLEPLQVDGPRRGAAVRADGDEGDRGRLGEPALARLLDPLAQAAAAGSASAIAGGTIPTAPRLGADVDATTTTPRPWAPPTAPTWSDRAEPDDRPADLGRRHQAPTTRAWPRSARSPTGARSSTAPAAPARRCGRCARRRRSATSPPTSRRRCCAGPASGPRSAASTERSSSSAPTRPKTCRWRTASADLFLSYWGLHCFPDPRGGDRRDRRGS